MKIKFLFFFISFVVSYSSYGQSGDFFYGNRSSGQALIVGGFDGQQFEGISSRTIVVSKSQELNANLGSNPNAVLDSIIFSKSSICGFDGYTGELKIYALSTMDSVVSTADTIFDFYRNQSVLVFQSNLVEIPTGQREIGLATNHGFKHDGNSHLMLLVEWTKPVVSSCIQMEWAGDTVQDQSVANWVFNGAKYVVSNTARFKVNFGLSFNSTAILCANASNLDVVLLEDNRVKLKPESSVASLDIELNIKKRNKYYPVWQANMSNGNSVETDQLVPNTEYVIMVKDKCVPKSYPGINNLYTLSSDCIAQLSLTKKANFTFDPDKSDNELSECWTFDDSLNYLSTKYPFVGKYSLILNDQTNKWFGTSGMYLLKDSTYNLSFQYMVRSGNTNPNFNLSFVLDTSTISEGNYMFFDSIVTYEDDVYNYFTTQFTPKHTGVFYLGAKLLVDNNEKDVYIDQLEIASNSCPISVVDSMEIGADYVKLMLKPQNGIESSIAYVDYGKQYFTSDNNELIIRTLSSNTRYTVQLESKCANSASSALAAPISFTTACYKDSLFINKETPIFIDDFEDVTCLKVYNHSNAIGTNPYDGFSGKALLIKSPNLPYVPRNLYFNQGDLIHFEVLVKPELNQLDLKPDIVVFQDGDFTQAIKVPTSMDTFNIYGEFRLVQGSFVATKTGKYQVGLQLPSAQSTLFDNFKVYRDPTCNLFSNVLNPKLLSPQQVKLSWRFRENQPTTTLLRIEDLDLKSTSYRVVNDTTIQISNLIENTHYSVSFGTICGMDTSSFSHSISFKTPCFIDTLTFTHPIKYGFESINEYYCMNNNGGEWEYGDSIGTEQNEIAISGKGYIHNPYEKGESQTYYPIYTNWFFAEKNKKINVRFDYLNFPFQGLSLPKTFNVYVELVDEDENNIEGSEAEITDKTYSQNFKIKESKKYKIRIVGVDKLTLDNIHITTENCTPLTNENIIVETVKDTLRVHFSDVKSPTTSLALKITHQNSVLYKELVALNDGDGEFFNVLPFVGDYKVSISNNCNVPKEIIIPFSTSSSAEVSDMDTISPSKRLEEDFELNTLMKSEVFSVDNTYGVPKVVNADELGFYANSGSKALHFEKTDDSISLKPCFLDTSYLYRFQFVPISKGLSANRLSLFVRDANTNHLVFTQTIYLLPSWSYRIFPVNFKVAQPGEYIITLKSTNATGFVIDDVALSAFYGEDNSIKTMQSTNLSNGLVELIWNKSIDPTNTGYQVELFAPKDGLHSVKSIKLNHRFDTMVVIDGLNPETKYTAFIYSLRESEKLFTNQRALVFQTECIVDTLKRLGDSYFNNFDHLRVISASPLCSGKGSIRANKSNFGGTHSGLLSVYNERLNPYVSKEFYLFKDSLYALSAWVHAPISIYSPNDSFYFTLNDNSNPSVYRQVGAKALLEPLENQKLYHKVYFKAKRTGNVNFKMHTQFYHLYVDDIRLQRVDSNEVKTNVKLWPIEKSETSITLSWNKLQGNVGYVLEHITDDQTTLDTILNLNDTFFSYNNLALGVKNHFRIGYIQSNFILWGKELTYISGHIADTVDYNKDYYRNFEDAISVNEGLQTADTLELYPLSSTEFALRKKISDTTSQRVFQTLLAKVYLDSGYQYSIRYFDRSASGKFSALSLDDTINGVEADTSFSYSINNSLKERVFKYTTKRSGVFYLVYESDIYQTRRNATIYIDNISIKKEGSCKKGIFKLNLDTVYFDGYKISWQNSLENVEKVVVSSEWKSSSSNVWKVDKLILDPTVKECYIDSLNEKLDLRVSIQAICYDTFSTPTPYEYVTVGCQSPQIVVNEKRPFIETFGLDFEKRAETCWTGNGFMEYKVGEKFGNYYRVVDSKSPRFYLVDTLSYRFTFSFYNLEENDTFQIDFVDAVTNKVVYSELYSNQELQKSFNQKKIYFQPSSSQDYYLHLIAKNGARMDELEIVVAEPNYCQVDSLQISLSDSFFTLDFSWADTSDFQLINFTNLATLDTGDFVFSKLTTPSVLRHQPYGKYQIEHQTICASGDTSQTWFYYVDAPKKLYKVADDSYCEDFNQYKKPVKRALDWTSKTEFEYNHAIYLENNAVPDHSENGWNKFVFYGPDLLLEPDKMYVGVASVLTKHDYSYYNNSLAWKDLNIGLYDYQNEKTYKIATGKNWNYNVYDHFADYVRVPVKGKYQLRLYASRNPVHKTNRILIYDNVCFYEDPNTSCLPPQQLRIARTIDSVSLQWQRVRNADLGYDWKLFDAQSNKLLFSGEGITSTDTFAHLLETNGGNIYTLSVRSKCGVSTDSVEIANGNFDENFSNWTEQVLVNVPCESKVVSTDLITESFEEFKGFLPRCWTSKNSTWSVVENRTYPVPLSGSDQYLWTTSNSESTSISSGNYGLEKDSIYRIGVYLSGDGQAGCDSLALYAINENNSEYFIGKLDSFIRNRAFKGRYLEFTAPKSSKYRFVFKATFNSVRNSKGLALDNFSIQQIPANCKPLRIIEVSDIHAAEVGISLNRVPLNNTLITKYINENTAWIDTITLSTPSLVLNKDQFKAWGRFSVEDQCEGVYYSSDEIVIPKYIEPIVVPSVGKTILDLNQVMTPYILPEGWKYQLPSTYAYDDSLYEENNIKVGENRGGYLSFTPFRNGSKQVESPQLELKRFVSYNLQFILSALNRNGKDTTYVGIDDGKQINWLDTLEVSWNQKVDYSQIFKFKVYSYQPHRLVFKSTNYQPVGIDSITLRELDLCPFNEFSLLNNITYQSADLILKNTFSSDLNWIVVEGDDFDPDGINSGSGKHNDTVHLQQLQPNTFYSIYTQKFCGTSDTSKWFKSITFRTDCAIDTPILDKPRCFDFETDLLCGSIENWTQEFDSLSTGEYTTSGRGFLYQNKNKSSEFASSLFYLKKGDNLEVEFLIQTAQFFGIDTFNCYLKNIKSNKKYSIQRWEDEVIDNLYQFQSSSLIEEDGLYELVLNAKPHLYSFVLVDNICYTKSSKCTPPLSLQIDSIHTEKVGFSWQNTNIFDSLRIKLNEVNTHGFVLVKDSTIDATQESTVVENLISDKLYQLWIFGSCSGNQSQDTLITIFRTKCIIPVIKDTVIYSENFELVHSDLSNHCFVFDPSDWQLDTSIAQWRKPLSGQNSLYGSSDGQIIFKRVKLLKGLEYKLKLNTLTSGTGIDTFVFGLMNEQGILLSKKLNNPSHTSYSSDSILFTAQTTENVQIVMFMKGSGNIVVDDVTLSEHLPCDAISNLNLEHLGNYTAEIKWSQNKQATLGYKAKVIDFIGDTVSVVGYTTQQNSRDTQLQVSGLFPGVNYRIVVNAQCGNAVAGPIMDTLSFITICPTYSVNELNAMGTMDVNDSNWHCWTFTNDSNSKHYNWHVGDSLFVKNKALKDYHDQVGYQYLTVSGIDSVSTNGVSTVKTPFIQFTGQENMLLFKMTDDNFSSITEYLEENNRLNIYLEDKLGKRLDTIFVFNGDLRVEWSEIFIEIPNNVDSAHMVFEFERNATVPYKSSIAIDGIRIEEGTCADVFNSAELNDFENNRVCVSLDDRYLVGREEKVGYGAQANSLDGVSLNLVDYIGITGATLVSDSVTIMNYDLNVAGNTVITLKNASLNRRNGVNEWGFVLPKSQISDVISLANIASGGQKTIGLQELYLYTSSDSLNPSVNGMSNIDDTEIKKLSFGTQVDDSTYVLDSIGNYYLFGVQASAIDQNLVIGFGKNTASTEVLNLGSLTVYPNPFESFVILDTRKLSSKVKEVQLYNMSGQMVWRNDALSKGIKRLEFGSLSAGVYNLRVAIGNQWYNHKLIKL